MVTKQQLNELADEKYRLFSEKLNPGVKPIMGVRVPQIRAIGKDIAAGDWRGFLDGEVGSDASLEERMLYGLVVGYVKKMTIDERLHYVERFVPLVNCWSVCDTCSLTFKFVTKNRERVYEFLQPYLRSQKEYEARFAIIMLLGYYIDGEYLERLFIHFSSVSLSCYYVQMAVAWAVSVCYVRFPDETFRFLQTRSMDAFTHNKSIQKIVESFRVSEADKARAVALRQK